MGKSPFQEWQYNKAVFKYKRSELFIIRYYKMYFKCKEGDLRTEEQKEVHAKKVKKKKKYRGQCK